MSDKPGKKADAETTAEEIPEAEVVEGPPPPADDEPGELDGKTAAEVALEEQGPGTELEISPVHAGQIIRAEDPEEILAKAAKIASSLKHLIEQNGLAVNVGGRKPHVEVGGWQAMGALLGALGGQPLHAEPSWIRRVIGPDGEPERTQYTAVVRNKKAGTETTYEVDGYSYEARVEIKTPAGVVVGAAEAMCHRNESKWGTADEYAVKSMAETRAESRAWRRAAGWLVAIAGYNPTPAEEMPGGSHEAVGSQLLTAGSRELEKIAKSWVLWILAGNKEAAAEVWGSIAGTGIDGNGGPAIGHVPRIVAQAFAKLGAKANELQQEAAKATRAQQPAPAGPAGDADRGSEGQPNTGEADVPADDADLRKVPDESQPGDDDIPF